MAPKLLRDFLKLEKLDEPPEGYQEIDIMENLEDEGIGSSDSINFEEEPNTKRVRNTLRAMSYTHASYDNRSGEVFLEFNYSNRMMYNELRSKPYGENIFRYIIHWTTRSAFQEKIRFSILFFLFNISMVIMKLEEFILSFSVIRRFSQEMIKSPAVDKMLAPLYALEQDSEYSSESKWELRTSLLERDLRATIVMILTCAFFANKSSNYKGMKRKVRVEKVFGFDPDDLFDLKRGSNRIGDEVIGICSRLLRILSEVDDIGEALSIDIGLDRKLVEPLLQLAHLNHNYSDIDQFRTVPYERRISILTCSFLRSTFLAGVNYVPSSYSAEVLDENMHRSILVQEMPSCEILFSESASRVYAPSWKTVETHRRNLSESFSVAFKILQMLAGERAIRNFGVIQRTKKWRVRYNPLNENEFQLIVEGGGKWLIFEIDEMQEDSIKLEGEPGKEKWVLRGKSIFSILEVMSLADREFKRISKLAERAYENKQTKYTMLLVKDKTFIAHNKAPVKNSDLSLQGKFVDDLLYLMKVGAGWIELERTILPSFVKITAAVILTFSIFELWSSKKEFLKMLEEWLLVLGGYGVLAGIFASLTDASDGLQGLMSSHARFSDSKRLRRYLGLSSEEMSASFFSCANSKKLLGPENTCYIRGKREGPLKVTEIARMRSTISRIGGVVGNFFLSANYGDLPIVVLGSNNVPHIYWEGAIEYCMKEFFEEKEMRSVLLRLKAGGANENWLKEKIQKIEGDEQKIAKIIQEILDETREVRSITVEINSQIGCRRSESKNAC